MFNVEIGVPGKLFRDSQAIAAASAAVAASGAAVSGSKLAVTHFSGSCDITALFTIESPSGTVIWRKRVTRPASTGVEVSENFDPPLVIATANQGVIGKVAAAATNTAEANIAGFEIASR